MGGRLADVECRTNENYGDKGLAAALKGCGISQEQFKGLVDWYLQDVGANGAGESAGVAREGERRHYRMRRVQMLPGGKAQALALSFSGHACCRRLR